MRVREPIKGAGYFCLPSKPQRQLPGTLSICDGGHIELEAVGLFEEAFFVRNERIGRIIGNVEKCGPVTLDNCFYLRRDVEFGGISKSLVDVGYAVLGASFGSDEEIQLNSLRFSIEGIDEWVGISGIKIDPNIENRTTTVTYEPPAEISLTLQNGMRLLITFTWNYSMSPDAKEARVTQRTYFRLVSDEKKELREFLSASYRLTNFLCFAIDQTVTLENLQATNEDKRLVGEDNPAMLQPIRIYYRSLPFSKDEPKIDPHEMLFRFSQIRDNAQCIFNNWFRAYERMEPAMNLYFSDMNIPSVYLEGKFLTLAQALETYHRRTSNTKPMNKETFERMVTELLNLCPKEYRKWLEKRLEHGNEITLAKRLREIIEPYKGHLGNYSKRERLIRDIVNTRNYLTHYDESLKDKAASGENLWLLYDQMVALFQLCLLRELGFTEQEIEFILEGSSQLRRSLHGI